MRKLSRARPRRRCAKRRGCSTSRICSSADHASSLGTAAAGGAPSFRQQMRERRVDERGIRHPGCAPRRDPAAPIGQAGNNQEPGLQGKVGRRHHFTCAYSWGHPLTIFHKGPPKGIGRHVEGGNPRDSGVVVGSIASFLAAHVLEEAGSTLTRENVLNIATTLNNLRVPMLLAGITVTTRPD